MNIYEPFVRALVPPDRLAAEEAINWLYHRNMDTIDVQRDDWRKYSAWGVSFERYCRERYLVVLATAPVIGFAAHATRIASSQGIDSASIVGICIVDSSSNKTVHMTSLPFGIVILK